MSQFIKQQSKTRVVAQERLETPVGSNSSKAISNRKSLGFRQVQQRSLQECVCVCVCACVGWGAGCLLCVCAILMSPLLHLSCITRGSLLVSPGDRQSVLALQYKEIIIFKKLPPRMGSVFLRGPCVG